jgi:hypothetical protein
MKRQEVCCYNCAQISFFAFGVLSREKSLINNSVQENLDKPNLDMEMGVVCAEIYERMYRCRMCRIALTVYASEPQEYDHIIETNRKFKQVQGNDAYLIAITCCSPESYLFV